jgi:hypothetical protein
LGWGGGAAPPPNHPKSTCLIQEMQQNPGFTPSLPHGTNSIACGTPDASAIMGQEAPDHRGGSPAGVGRFCFMPIVEFLTGATVLPDAGQLGGSLAVVTKDT